MQKPKTVVERIEALEAIMQKHAERIRKAEAEIASTAGQVGEAEHSETLPGGSKPPAAGGS